MIQRLSYLEVWIFTVLVITPGIVSCMKDLHPTVHRVPESQRQEHKHLKAPLGETRKAPVEIVAEGKHLYEGKGSCYQCHGLSGKGDGPAAHMLNPAPPDFTDCAFHKAREDGELFWIIKHGIPGTQMVNFVPGQLTEEEAWRIVAYVRSFCKGS